MPKLAKKPAPAWKRLADEYSEWGDKARLARQTGVPLYALSRVLKGRRRASWDIAEKLSAVSGIPAREFASLK
jgi:transcriptional regulator with XRE-family HTH domain